MVTLDQLALSRRDLEREAKAAEGNYLLYLGKREQERASNAMDVTRIANVAIAVPPAIPVLPTHSWLFNGVLGLSHRRLSQHRDWLCRGLLRHLVPYTRSGERYPRNSSCDCHAETGGVRRMQW